MGVLPWAKMIKPLQELELFVGFEFRGFHGPKPSQAQALSPIGELTDRHVSYFLRFLGLVPLADCSVLFFVDLR
jgi:hypothetical protein